ERISLFSYAIDTRYFRENSRLSPEARRSLRARYGLPGHSKGILSVAKFNGREAPWDLLEAFCALEGSDLRLLLVGDGPQREALEQCARSRGKGRVRFAGYVPY